MDVWLEKTEQQATTIDSLVFRFGQFAKELWPGVNTWYAEKYAEFETYKEIFK